MEIRIEGNKKIRLQGNTGMKGKRGGIQVEWKEVEVLEGVESGVSVEHLAFGS